MKVRKVSEKLKSLVGALFLLAGLTACVGMQASGSGEVSATQAGSALEPPQSTSTQDAEALPIPVASNAQGPMSPVGFAVAPIPGHPEGEISPLLDVGHDNDYWMTASQELLCKALDGRWLIRVEGHLEKKQGPCCGQSFLRLLDLKAKTYFDIPLEERAGVPASFEFRFIGDSPYDLGFFLSKESGPTPSPWGQILPWPSAETPTEGFFNLANPANVFVSQVPASEGACPIPGIMKLESDPFLLLR